MNSVLISIHPKHVERILSGEKKFEFRKSLPKREIVSLFIYATAPVKKIVAVAGVGAMLSDEPSALWGETAFGAGIDRGFFDGYFAGKDVGHAIQLDNVVKFHEPLCLGDLPDPMKAPQSWCYIRRRNWLHVLFSEYGCALQSGLEEEDMTI